MQGYDVALCDRAGVDVTGCYESYEEGHSKT